MSDSGPDWQARARRLAATALMVAFAACVAMNVLRQILPMLILCAVVTAVVALLVAIVRARRHRW